MREVRVRRALSLVHLVEPAIGVEAARQRPLGEMPADGTEDGDAAGRGVAHEDAPVAKHDDAVRARTPSGPTPIDAGSPITYSSAPSSVPMQISATSAVVSPHVLPDSVRTTTVSPTVSTAACQRSASRPPLDGGPQATKKVLADAASTASATAPPGQTSAA